MARLFPHFKLSERLGGAKIVDIPALTVSDLFAKGASLYGPDFGCEIAVLTVLVNGRNIRYLRGMSTPLEPDDEVAFVVPAAGG